jgi:hypothetical protein
MKFKLTQRSVLLALTESLPGFPLSPDVQKPPLGRFLGWVGIGGLEPPTIGLRGRCSTD